MAARSRKVQRRRFDGKREAVAFFKRRDVFDVFVARVADLEKIGLEDGNAVRKEFRERTVQIFAQTCVQGVLKNVRKLSGDFREFRVAVAA